MQAHFAGTERTATQRTGAEPVRGIMALKSGTRAFRRGGSGLASDISRSIPAEELEPTRHPAFLVHPGVARQRIGRTAASHQ